MSDKPAAMSPLKAVVVAVAAVLIVVFAIAAQRQVAATGAADAAPAVTTEGAVPEATGTADAEQEAYRRWLLTELPRREEGDPLARGRVDATIVMTEWADYRCPYCSACPSRSRASPAAETRAVRSARSCSARPTGSRAACTGPLLGAVLTVAAVPPRGAARLGGRRGAGPGVPAGHRGARRRRAVALAGLTPQPGRGILKDTLVGRESSPVSLSCSS